MGSGRLRLAFLASVAALALLAGGLGVEEPAAQATTFTERSVPTAAPATVAALPPVSPARPVEVPSHDRTPVPRELLVEIERALPITARPGAGPVVGTMPSGSKYYAVSIVAWVRDVSRDGRFGLVDVPYVADRATGWIDLRGLDRSTTPITVEADLSEHRLTVLRGDRVVLRTPAATGAAVSPTPPGRYFVTDRVRFPGGGSLGTFAFGISGIQPNLPPGWSGGDQLAIHGTNAPWTIGRSASAGCLRVSERILDRLRPLLRLGTPVIVRP